ncbi:MAG: SecD/SecF fusion protein [Gaiellaceae bacterium]|jgi:SecD/SecF fusion protein|nr:SecD/SecF fusion protein [Gaiellaceae bacterium]MDX6469005.1 SecD/SecF fusion protein [Gaiellaceae bacterium]
MGAIAIAFVAAILLAVPGSPIQKKPTLGLDLQGGLEVVLQAVPPKGHTLTADDLNRSITIMQQRINKLGVSEPEIRKQGTNQIVIQLAGVHNAAAAAALIGKTAQLLFFDFEPNLVGPSKGPNDTPVATPGLYEMLTQVQSSTGAPESYYLFKNKTVTTKPAKKGGKATTTVQHSIVRQADTRTALLNPTGGKVPKGDQVLKVPANTIVVRCAATTGCLGATAASKSGSYYYLLKYYPNRPDGPPELTGKDLNLSGISAQIDPNTGQWSTLLSFTNHGSNQFQKITKAEYERGKIAAGLAGAGNSSANVQQYAGHSAIVLDGELQSTPYIDYTDSALQDGISGGAQITTGSQKQAQDLALILQTGALPVSFKQVERTDVSATLGKDSLTQAWHAAAVGLVIVALFLLLLYRFLGLVAVLGLAIYGAFYYAAILLFNVTLTLPGFAGLILTIGVAADANVVVFERIKEEVRAGKSVRAAIAAGYGKGFHTILDANVVTAITALVLFLIAVASVKGFALMLLIGTVISLVTAVAATRGLLGLLAGFRWFDNPRFMGAQGQQTAKWLQIDFMRRRNVWFAISGAVILAGAISLGVRGLNLGIDFKGGTQITFNTHKAYTQAAVAKVVAQAGEAGAVVQGRGASTNQTYTQWQIRTLSLSGPKQSALSSDLQTKLGAYASGVKNVSSSFGHQIALDAIWGIIVSLILIVIYIGLRFGAKYSIPVILAMLHDIVITVGVYSLAFKEVSVATVAAVLTVLGYSIYDTIIIFDRVRENVPLMRRQSFATIVNVSLWETIRRSLATTFITLLPIVALEFLGGATLKDFAFALIVGVASGAYSSIFIAAPLLTMWKEREPEFAKRKQLAPGEDVGPTVGGRRARKADTGTAVLEASEQALAAEPTPELVDVIDATPSAPAAQDRREKRRQRRRTRPHGRAR